MRSTELIASRIADLEPLVRTEILVALREPQRRIVALIEARRRDLEDLADLESDFGMSDFGAY